MFQSLFSQLFARRQSGPATAQEIFVAIPAARARLAELLEEQSQASLERADGIDGAQQRLSASCLRTAEARAELEAFVLAHERAVKREAESAKQAAEAARRAARDAAEGLLAQAGESQRAMAVAIEDFARAYAKTSELRAAARVAGFGMWPSHAAIDSAGALRTAVETELLRASLLAGLGQNLPGARAHDLRHLGNADPALVPELAAIFAQADSHVRAHMASVLQADGPAAAAPAERLQAA